MKIKNYLTETFISEESSPAIALNTKIRKDNSKVNKAGVKAVEKDSLDYNKSLKQDKETSKMAPNKFNYNDDFENEYHDEMEIMNGQEMIQYDRKPNSEFIKRAEEAIVGSSNMGNNPEWANVVPKQQGFEGPDFGKNLVKKIKDSVKKRNDQTPTINLRGQNIQADLEDTGNRPYAIQENLLNNNNKTPQIKESMKRLRFKNEFKGLGNALKLIPEGYKVDNKQFEMTDGNETYKIRWEGNLSEGKAVILTAADKTLVNEDIKRMRELFGYKSQDTLGLVKGNARINENKIFNDILTKSKSLFNEGEDIESAKTEKGNWEEKTKKAPEATKHIQGTTSTDKGTKAPKAKEGDASKAVSQAPEAKKHIESGKSKGTATKPKEGNWDDVSGGEKMMDINVPTPKEGKWEDITITQAPEATKHIEGTTSTDKGTKAPAPKQGYWEDASIKQSAEAKKHLQITESEMTDEDLKKQIEEDMMKMAESPVREVEGEEEEEAETEDSWNKSDDEDESSEVEPSGSDVSSSVPMDNDDDDDDDISVPSPMSAPKQSVAPQLLFSPSKGIYWIKGPSLPPNGMEVPAEYMSIASDSTKKASEKAALIIQKMDEMGGEEELGGM